MSKKKCKVSAQESPYQNVFFSKNDGPCFYRRVTNRQQKNAGEKKNATNLVWTLPPRGGRQVVVPFNQKIEGTTTGLRDPQLLDDP